MTTSETIKNIAAALVEFHKAVGKISKDATNPFFRSTYCSLPNLLDAINAPMVSNGLSIVQFPEGENGLTTRIMHVSGEWMESNYVMKPVKDTPQDRGSAITYQRRYAIGAILSLNIDDDDDANLATHGASTPQQAATKAEKVANQQDLDPNGNPKKWLNHGTKEYDATVKKLEDGNTSLATVALYFKLNKEVRAELQQYEKKA